MRERQLARLLIQMGLDRGVEMQRIAREVAGLPLPTFVDVQAWRDAVVEEVEARLRAEVEDQIAELRQQLGLPRPVQGRVQIPPAEPVAAAPQPAAPAAEPASMPAEPPEARDPDLPSDATMIWSTRRDDQR